MNQNQSLGQALKSYIWWTYDRGSVPYDIMVTLILLFLFLSPRLIDFKATPVSTVALHTSEILVQEAGTSPSGSSRFLYEMRADDVAAAARSLAQPMDTDPGRRSAILRTIEPIAGEVTLERYEAVQDTRGKTVAYRAWILR
jgi:hypothetical protein